MATKTRMFAHSMKDACAMLAAAMFAAVLTGCAGAGVKTGQFVDDSAITTKVKTAYAADKTVSAMNVHVETVKGDVRLSGFVKTPTEKRQAEELARSVAGVRSVTNALVVRNEM